MKTTSDGKEVPPRLWYYLLDFNDRDNWQLMQKMFNEMKLHELTHKQFGELFKLVSALDIESNFK